MLDQCRFTDACMAVTAMNKVRARRRPRRYRRHAARAWRVRVRTRAWPPPPSTWREAGEQGATQTWLHAQATACRIGAQENNAQNEGVIVGIRHG